MSAATSQILDSNNLPLMDPTAETPTPPTQGEISLPSPPSVMPTQPLDPSEEKDIEHTITDLICDYNNNALNTIITSPNSPTTVMEALNTNSSEHLINSSEHLINAKPIVRVELMDFNYQPNPGEVFQVNAERRLIRLQLTPGSIFQVNMMGCLQELIMPVPLSK
jgi:hypothetical protein